MKLALIAGLALVLAGCSYLSVARLRAPAPDIGAQINAEMAALPAGGTIKIPPGHYSFPTTIQCPKAGNATYHVEGSSRMSYTTGLGWAVSNEGGTTLDYTGNGVAIDQTITDNTYQWEALKGCEFRNFSLVNKGSPYATGIQFSGTQRTVIDQVAITGFYHGINVLNVPGATTERYTINATLENNDYGIYFYAFAGGSNSFAFGRIDIDLLLRANPTGRTAIYIDGDAGVGATLYNSTISISGNILAVPTTGTQSYIMEVGGKGSITNNTIDLRLECDGASGFCGRIYNNGTFSGNHVTQSLEAFNGMWGDGGNNRLTMQEVQR